MPASETNLSLILNPDSVSNTTITTESGEHLYTVKTEHGKKASMTYVRNASDEVIASLEWRDALPDKVTIAANKPMLMTSWMKRSMIPFKDDISFVDGQQRKYKWKGNSAGRNFELYSADDNYTAVIARFQRSRRVHPQKTAEKLNPSVSTVSVTPTVIPSARTPAVLTLTPRAVEIQDTVITSFLFLEKTHRTNETEHQNRADVLCTPGLGGVTGNYLIRDGGV